MKDSNIKYYLDKLSDCKYLKVECDKQTDIMIIIMSVMLFVQLLAYLIIRILTYKQK